MSHPKSPLPCKLFFTVIFNPQTDIEPLRKELEDRVGEIELESDLFPFDVTDYYAREMGHGLVRVFYVMSGLFERTYIVEAKHMSYELERMFLEHGRRKYNVDPGIVTLENVLLSTFKNYYHRIYLGKGVFAEVTLAYIKGELRPFEWTYPDYRRDEMREFLLSVRNRLYQETIAERK